MTTTRKVYFTGNPYDMFQLPIAAGKSANFAGGYHVTEDLETQDGIERYWKATNKTDGIVEDFDELKHAALIRNGANPQAQQAIIGVQHVNSMPGTRSADAASNQLLDALMDGSAAQLLANKAAELTALGMQANEAVSSTVGHESATATLKAQAAAKAAK